MKLIENLGDLPKRAGDAEIVLSARKNDGYGRVSPLAQRNAQTIVLEENASMRFYSLLGGRQFLYTVDDKDRNRHMFFGGTDESPFLVELELSALEGLVRDEKGFFEGLKPPIVRTWEQNLVEVKTRRQGDFFAVAPARAWNWGGFLRTYLGIWKMKAEISEVKGLTLRGTRHKFSGLIASMGGFSIGEGTIEAPDHSPLALDGPHLIEQAVHLLRPQEAD